MRVHGFLHTGTLVSGTSTNGTWDFTIIAADMGGLIIGDNIQYYVVAQDLAGTPNINSNPVGVVASDVNTITTHPTTPNSYIINSVLNGDIYDWCYRKFSTITAAVNAYNNSCLTGPVSF